jgi:hypothetical protein
LALPNALIDQIPKNFRRRLDLRHRADRFAGKEGHRRDRSCRGFVNTRACETQRRHPYAVERGYLPDRITLEGFGRNDLSPVPRFVSSPSGRLPIIISLAPSEPKIAVG